MLHVGVDLEQFVRDPQASGIQRVLQQLALAWPEDLASCDWVVPFDGRNMLLSSEQAATLLSLAFARGQSSDLREAVTASLLEFSGHCPIVERGRLLALYGAWLLPEVSYLPTVLERYRLFARTMPASMIGYDTFPMTDPANYRFRPGTAAQVSEYFRLLADADSVVCISEFARAQIWTRLRRDRSKPISVANPGGDHVPPVSVSEEARTYGQRRPIRFLRIGTFEARKLPVELVRAFESVVREGISAEMLFIGRPSASDFGINAEVERAVSAGIGVSWLRECDDDAVQQSVRDSDIFISVGSEGYGIPVLEAIRQGIPVVFGGIQPAAMLVEGNGSHDIGDPSPTALETMFRTFSDPVTVRALRDAVDPDAVPTWNGFAREVVRGVLAA